MPSTPAYRVLIDAIARLQRVQREVAHELARDLDCPRASLSLLWLLDKAGELGIGDVAQHLHVDISVASRQATQLVEAGYAERSTPDAPGTDRRVRTVRLTERGRAFTADTKVAMDARAAEALRSCSDGFAEWRQAWTEALGLAGKRPKKVRPDGAGLRAGRDAAVARLEQGLSELSASRERRAQVVDRLAALRAGL